MTIVSVSCGNAAFGANAAWKPGYDATLGIRGDCLLFDGVETMTYRSAGTKTASKGTYTETGWVAYVCPHALKRQVTRRELWASNGRLREGDAAFEFPRLELPVQPREGDAIFLAGERWNVIAADEATLRSRWRVFGRVGV